jgi:hypothetical protein
MKRTLILAMGAVLVVPILLFNVVTAQTGTSDSSTTTSAADDQENKQEIKKASDDPATLKARLDARKAELKTKLTTTEQTRIKNKCVASQGNVSSLRGRIKGIETSRTNVYDTLVDRLTKLSTQVKDKGVDTTKLESEITELKAKVQTFQTDLAAYKQALTDLAAMDCKSDPTAFKASLESARTLQKKVQADGVAIKSYINDTIKVTLKDVRSQLEGGTN